MHDRLTLPEELALLLIRPDGTLAVAGQTLDVGLAGAVLADLALRRSVSLSGRHVAVASEGSVGEPLLDAVVASIASSAKPRSAKQWVSSLGKRAMRDAVTDSLVRRGVVREERRSVLGIFPSTRYPERDGAIEARLRSELRAVLDGSMTPTPQRATLVGLLDATGTLRKQFPGTDRRLVKQIVAGDWAAPAVRAVLQEVQAAALMAITAASTAATAGVIASS